MKFQKISFFLITGLAIRLITAYFSEGYWHPDEHFQIFEFMHHLRGNISSLAWEWSEQMRQLIQVQFYRILLGDLC